MVFSKGGKLDHRGWSLQFFLSGRRLGLIWELWFRVRNDLEEHWGREQGRSSPFGLCKSHMLNGGATSPPASSPSTRRQVSSLRPWKRQRARWLTDQNGQRNWLDFARPVGQTCPLSAPIPLGMANARHRSGRRWRIRKS